ncbi:MAG: S-methyl-5'-thioadenosine phosphorylase [Chloroflexi bacterium]|nr:MAG: S-methyl-5'-thioadenosine phosphorylase [Chloroflexota bacterium]
MTLGVLGGSGLYSMEGLQIVETRELTTPFGSPSSPLTFGELNGSPVVFLARHGMGHTLSPTEVNYRANIYALKEVGVEQVVAVSACGSLREDYAPGHVVVPDQIFDLTRLRPRSFFEGGLVAHVSVADPFCPDLTPAVVESLRAAQAEVHEGGTLITIEGPRFSTRAESNTFRAWGMSIIGMTSSPEAFLAREAEMCYSVMAPVTDYDVWHKSEETVTVDLVMRTIEENAQVVQAALSELIDRLPTERKCICENALEGALITSRESIPPETLEKLKLLVQRYYR